MSDILDSARRLLAQMVLHLAIWIHGGEIANTFTEFAQIRLREALPNNHGSGFATPPDAKPKKTPEGL